MRELTVSELEYVSGGVDLAAIGVGIAAVGLGLAIVGTAGLASIPIGILIGAGTVGEIVVGGAAVVLAAGGGFGIGYGLVC